MICDRTELLRRKIIMFEELPKDPMLLLSVINTKLRDYYPNLDLLCEELQIDSETLKKRLAEIDYEYDPEQNRFI